MNIELFKCNDGDQWYSVVQDGDIATGLMHATSEEAEKELAELHASSR